MSQQRDASVAEGWEIELAQIREHQEWNAVLVAPRRWKVVDKRGIPGHDGQFSCPNEAASLCRRLNAAAR